jgi:hypothetical protein
MVTWKRGCLRTVDNRVLRHVWNLRHGGRPLLTSFGVETYLTPRRAWHERTCEDDLE